MAKVPHRPHCVDWLVTAHSVSENNDAIPRLAPHTAGFARRIDRSCTRQRPSGPGAGQPVFGLALGNRPSRRTRGPRCPADVGYVKLASGRELVLVGDIVWRMPGIDLQRQKPDSVSRMLGEDRPQIAQQLAWLKNVVAAAGIAIAVSHDGDALRALVSRGVLTAGVDPTAPTPPPT